LKYIQVFALHLQCWIIVVYLLFSLNLLCQYHNYLLVIQNTESCLYLVSQLSQYAESRHPMCHFGDCGGVTVSGVDNEVYTILVILPRLWLKGRIFQIFNTYAIHFIVYITFCDAPALTKMTHRIYIWIYIYI
jgi:hypothetical protein